MSLDNLLNALPADPKAAPLSTKNGTPAATTRTTGRWHDDLIAGPTPDARNNALQRLVSRWVEKHLSETEIRLAADALAVKWDLDGTERMKLDDMITRALDRGPQFSTEDEEPEDYLDTEIDPLADLIDRATNPPDRSNVLSTGIVALDNTTLGGMYPSQLWILAAFAWVGKSVVTTQISYNAALRGADVLYVSTEASPLEIRVRVMSQTYQYPASRLLRIMSGSLAADSMDKQMMHRWRDSEPMRAQLDPLRRRFEIRDDLDSIEAIERRLVERARRGRPVRILVVDQLNDLSTPGLEGRFAVESISKGLKMLTRRYGCTTVACSQVNRGNDTAKILATETKGEIWTPDVFNLRETEVLRHHAHSLIFLGRNYGPAGDPGVMAVRAAKVRGAAVVPPVFQLRYQPKYLLTSVPEKAPSTFPYVVGDDR